MLIHCLGQILALGGGGGVHADKAEPNALRQPAQAVQLLRNAGGDVLTHVGVIHQGSKTEGAGGIAQSGARLHIAAGGSIGADAAQDQIIGETGIRHRCFKNHRTVPLVLRLAAAVQRAGSGGVNRLRVGKGKYQLRAAVCQIGMVLGAAFVGGAVQGIGITAPAAGKVLDGAQAFLRQREEPLVHLPGQHCLLGISAHCFCVDVNIQGEGSQKKHRAEYQGQHFFQNHLSHRVQLLSQSPVRGSIYIIHIFLNFAMGAVPAVSEGKGRSIPNFGENARRRNL